MQGSARKGKVVKGLKTLKYSTIQEEPPLKKDGSDNGENLDSSCSEVQAEESASSANTLSIEKISKSEILAGSLIVIASLTEAMSVDENEKKCSD